MKYRLLVIFLVSFLIGSFSLNMIHYEAMIRAENDKKFNENFYSEIINKLHKRIIESEI